VPLCRHKVLSSGPSTAKEKTKIYIFRNKDIAQWESVYPACARPWVQFPSIAKKKMVRKINGINVTSAISWWKKVV
jgi:hypothetical protein